MKCSQATRQVLCRFYFQNTADEDYYILEDNTPLEGLRYPYLSISQGDKVIEYQGIHVSRMAPIKDSYVLIEAGKTITSPVVDLTSSYKFDSDGIYTIEYTKPFVYISDAEMSNVEEDDILPYTAPLHSALVASTVVKLVDTYNFKPTDVEMDLEMLNFRETTSITQVNGNDEVETQAMQCLLDELSLDDISQKVQRETREAHNLVCDTGYPLASADVVNNNNESPYKDFFGTQPFYQVQRVINSCLGAVRNNQKKMMYSFRGSKCRPQDYAYSSYDSPHIILCKPFEKLATKRTSWFTSYYTKFETIAHEMTHIYGNTVDYEYGHNDCKKYAKTNPNKAVKNADSFGNYIQQVYYNSL